MADDTYSKSDLDKAIKEAVDEATKGLKTNLETALDEAKEAKRKLRAASEIKPEDLTAAEERADKAEARVKELEKTTKDATTAKDKAEGALKTEQAFTHKLVVENGLREQLTAAGVTNPAHQKARSPCSPRRCRSRPKATTASRRSVTRCWPTT
jgi:copper homeostasis protein CutC